VTNFLAIFKFLKAVKGLLAWDRTSFWTDSFYPGAEGSRYRQSTF